MNNLAIICIELDVMNGTLMVLYECRDDQHHTWPYNVARDGHINIINLLYIEKHWYFIDTGRVGEAFSSVRITHV